jgi:hypothetical protein
MMNRSHNDTLRAFDRLQSRAFDTLAKFYPAELIFNGKKARVISTAIASEYVQEIVGYLPKRSASVEIKQSDLARLGCTNESYVSLDGTVLRLRQVPQDGADISIKFYAHSTPDQGTAPAVEDSGSVTLAIGQVAVPLLFKNVNPNKPHVFTVLSIENAVDAPPILDLGITPGQVVGNGRRLELDGAPDTVNYVLHWKAVQQ